MTTTDLIKYLREIAQYGNTITENDRTKLNQAADRLKELDERVAIMTEPTAQDATRNIGEAFKTFCEQTNNMTSTERHGL